jgi:hypothetical protein
MTQPQLDHPEPLAGYDRLTAEDWTRLVATVRTLGRTSGPNLIDTVAGLAFRAAPADWEQFPARIAGIPPMQYQPPYGYDWYEQTWDPTNKKWTDKPGGRSASATGFWASEMSASLRTGPAVVMLTSAVVDGSPLFLFQAPSPTFDARITGSTPVLSAQYQWSYTFEEVYLSGAGVMGWNTLAGGRTSDTYPALNRMEIINGQSTLLGNGVHTSNLTGQILPQPVAPGVVVRMDEIFLPGGGDGYLAYWFEQPNGLDGTC